MYESGHIAMLTGDSHKDVKFMLRMFIPTSNGKISRRRYIFSFILINFIFAFLIIFFNDGEAGFLVIVSTIVLHYLVINMNCQRLRDSGFIYIKTYVFGTLAVYGNDSNLLIVFYVQIMPDDFVMQLHRF